MHETSRNGCLNEFYQCAKLTEQTNAKIAICEVITCLNNCYWNSQRQHWCQSRL